MLPVGIEEPTPLSDWNLNNLVVSLKDILLRLFDDVFFAEGLDSIEQFVCKCLGRLNPVQASAQIGTDIILGCYQTHQLPHPYLSLLLITSPQEHRLGLLLEKDGQSIAEISWCLQRLRDLC